VIALSITDLAVGGGVLTDFPITGLDTSGSYVTS
jgi:hypothetical protein